jgi:E-phenylitaconyl-CoA hydratase
LRMGLVSKVVPHDQLMPAALAIARRIASNAPLAVRAIKQLVTRGQEMPLSQALQVDKYMYGILKDTEDRVEGRKAFAEKRDPVWKMR